MTMMLPFFQLDAFTTETFKGNPAAIVPLTAWLPEACMQAIAVENNLSETAFYVLNAQGVYEIRWFSPLKEIAFCGHATLASAAVIFAAQTRYEPIVFSAPAVGLLRVTRNADQLIEMRFPQRPPEPVTDIPADLLAGLSIAPLAVLKNQQAYVVVYAHEDQVRSVIPNLENLARLAPLDVVVTAPGRDYDFVSRYFWPANGGEEDPVTGSIHTALAPYWAQRLGKLQLRALQASSRTGVLHCRLSEDSVYVAGHTVLYLTGQLHLPA